MNACRVRLHVMGEKTSLPETCKERASSHSDEFRSDSRLESYSCRGRVSSAGRASALQVSRVNHTRSASGVAYARCNQPLELDPSWTESRPQIFGATLSWVLRRNLQVTLKSATLRLTGKKPT